MSINIDSFRVMADGKYNLGSVVVSKNDQGQEQLAKVNNHRWFSNSCTISANQNLTARTALFTAVRDEVWRQLGVTNQSGTDFLEGLRKDLLSGGAGNQELTRSDVLAKTLAKMDSFLDACKSLGDRQFSSVEVSNYQRRASGNDQLQRLLGEVAADKELLAKFGLAPEEAKRALQQSGMAVSTRALVMLDAAHRDHGTMVANEDGGVELEIDDDLVENEGEFDLQELLSNDGDADHELMMAQVIKPALARALSSVVDESKSAAGREHARAVLKGDQLQLANAFLESKVGLPEKVNFEQLHELASLMRDFAEVPDGKAGQSKQLQLGDIKLELTRRADSTVSVKLGGVKFSSSMTAQQLMEKFDLAVAGFAAKNASPTERIKDHFLHSIKEMLGNGVGKSIITDAHAREVAKTAINAHFPNLHGLSFEGVETSTLLDFALKLRDYKNQDAFLKDVELRTNPLQLNSKTVDSLILNMQEEKDKTLSEKVKISVHAQDSNDSPEKLKLDKQERTVRDFLADLILNEDPRDVDGSMVTDVDHHASFGPERLKSVLKRAPEALKIIIDMKDGDKLSQRLGDKATAKIVGAIRDSVVNCVADEVFNVLMQDEVHEQFQDACEFMRENHSGWTDKLKANVMRTKLLEAFFGDKAEKYMYAPENSRQMGVIYQCADDPEAFRSSEDFASCMQNLARYLLTADDKAIEQITGKPDFRSKAMETAFEKMDFADLETMIDDSIGEQVETIQQVVNENFLDSVGFTAEEVEQGIQRREEIRKKAPHAAMAFFLGFVPKDQLYVLTVLEHGTNLEKSPTQPLSTSGSGENESEAFRLRRLNSLLGTGITNRLQNKELQEDLIKRLQLPEVGFTKEQARQFIIKGEYCRLTDGNFTGSLTPRQQYNLLLEIFSVFKEEELEELERVCNPSGQQGGAQVREFDTFFTSFIDALKCNESLHSLAPADGMTDQHECVISKLINEDANIFEQAFEDIDRATAGEVEKKKAKAEQARKEAESKRIKDASLEVLAAGSDDKGMRKFTRDVISVYFQDSSLIDRRSFFAAIVRYGSAMAPQPIPVGETAEQKEVREKNEKEEEVWRAFGAMVKGAGPLMQKYLQGYPVSPSDSPAKKRAFASLKDDIPPIPESAVKAQLLSIVNSSNGRIKSIEALKVLGSASVGEALLCKVVTPDNPEGRECVVKLLRPNVMTRIDRERKIFEQQAKLTPGMEQTFQGELKTILAELDLRLEAENVKAGQIYSGTFNNVESMKLLDVAMPTQDSMVVEKAPGSTIKKLLQGYSEKIAEIKQQITECCCSQFVDYSVDNIRSIVPLLEELMTVRGEMVSLSRALSNLAAKWVTEGIYGQGFYHGDMHSGNLMFDPQSGVVTVIDFGNSMQLKPEEQKNVMLMLTAAAYNGPKDFIQGFVSLLSPEGKQIYENDKREIDQLVKDIISKGGKQDAGLRIAALITELQNRGMEIPPQVSRFSASQLRLANTIDELNGLIANAFTGGKKPDGTNYDIFGNIANRYDYCKQLPGGGKVAKQLDRAVNRFTRSSGEIMDSNDIMSSFCDHFFNKTWKQDDNGQDVVYCDMSSSDSKTQLQELQQKLESRSKVLSDMLNGSGKQHVDFVAFRENVILGNYGDSNRSFEPFATIDVYSNMVPTSISECCTPNGEYREMPYIYEWLNEHKGDKKAHDEMLASLRIVANYMQEVNLFKDDMAGKKLAEADGIVVGKMNEQLGKARQPPVTQEEVENAFFNVWKNIVSMERDNVLKMQGMLTKGIGYRKYSPDEFLNVMGGVIKDKVSATMSMLGLGKAIYYVGKEIFS